MKRLIKTTVLTLLCAAAALFLTSCAKSDAARYADAQNLLTQGKYGEALAAFSEIGNYEDSSRHIMYITAIQLAEEGQYEPAVKSLGSLKDFKDSELLVLYYTARNLEASRRYEEAGRIYGNIAAFRDSMDRQPKLRDLILQRDFGIAKARLESGNAQGAYDLARELLGQSYSDSATRMQEDIYALAGQALDGRDYAIAHDMFALLARTGYADAGIRQLDCVHADALHLIEQGDYSGAKERLILLADYPAAAESLKECDYLLALQAAEEGDHARAYDVFSALKGYGDSAGKAKAYEEKYAEAMGMQASGDFDAAQAAFATLGNYADSAAQAQESLYMKGKRLQADGSFDDARELFVGLGAYADSAAQAQESLYMKGKRLQADGNHRDAVIIFLKLGEYRDAASLVANDPGLSSAAAEIDRRFSPGNLILFGRYEQDNNTGNGKEAVSWRVLARKGYTALLASEKILDAKPYHGEDASVTWETSTLRAWLNGEFLNAAFTAEERTAILTAAATHKGIVQHGTEAGNEPADGIFLLSVAEAESLMGNDEERRAMNTAFAIALGAYSDEGYGMWWLRTPGDDANRAALVDTDGSVYAIGNVVNGGYGAVRPALYIDCLNSAHF